jgi:hypothetical protein
MEDRAVGMLRAPYSVGWRIYESVDDIYMDKIEGTMLALNEIRVVVRTKWNVPENGYLRPGQIAYDGLQMSALRSKLSCIRNSHMIA